MLLKSSKSLVFDAAILNEFSFRCFKGLQISKPLFVYALQSGFYEVNSAQTIKLAAQGSLPEENITSKNDKWLTSLTTYPFPYSLHRSRLLVRILSQNRYFYPIGVLRNMIRKESGKIKILEAGTLSKSNNLVAKCVSSCN